MSQAISPGRRCDPMISSSARESRNLAFSARTRNRRLSRVSQALRKDTGQPSELREATRRAVACEAGEGWWGRKDSNLRSHEAADLQSAPFATRDTPPLRPHRKPSRRIGEIRPPMTLKTASLLEGSGRARLWAKGHGKVNQGRRPICSVISAQIAIIRNP